MNRRHVLSVACLALALAASPSASQSFKIQMASVSPTSTAGGSSSGIGQVSEDGRFLVFGSSSANLVPNDTNGKPDVFLRDLRLQKTTRISVSATGAQGNDQSGRCVISADGNTIVFQSQASNLVPNDTNGLRDIFVFNRTTGRLSRINVSPTNQQALGGTSEIPTISRNGRFVGFMSHATNLVVPDTNGRVADAFVRDLRTGKTINVHRNSNGTQGNVGAGPAYISAYGRYVLFQSDSTNLVAGDTNSRHDVFYRDIETGKTSRISVSAAGAQANGNSVVTRPSRYALSDTGRYATFSSRATNLVPNDTNGQVDIFVKDVHTGRIFRANVNDLGQEGRGGRTHWDPQATISGDGRFVAFYALDSNLVARDWNGTWDVFVRDTLLQRTVLVSRNNQGQQGNNRHFEPYLTRNGRFTGFGSDSTNLSKIPATSNQVYAVDRGTTFGYAEHLDGGCGANSRSTATLESTPPVLGRTAILSGRSAPRNTAGVALVSPVHRSPLKIGRCLIHVDLATWMPLAANSDASGNWQIRFRVPNQLHLKGAQATTQAVFPGNGGAIGLELTNAVIWTLGE